jgi:hypothetical protein
MTTLVLEKGEGGRRANKVKSTSSISEWGRHVVSYRIENEPTVCSDNGGLALSKEWIDGVIKRRMKMKELFDRRSDFDRSRWEDIVE